MNVELERQRQQTILQKQIHQQQQLRIQRDPTPSNDLNSIAERFSPSHESVLPGSIIPPPGSIIPPPSIRKTKGSFSLSANSGRNGDIVGDAGTRIASNSVQGTEQPPIADSMGSSTGALVTDWGQDLKRTYQWFRDSTNLTGPDFIFPFFSVKNIQHRGAGRYTCLVTSEPNLGTVIVDTIIRISGK